MNKWIETYEQLIKRIGSTDKFIKFSIIRKNKLIEIIKNYAERNKVILEAGSGTGIISSFLSTQGYKVVGVDIDNNMLDFAKKMSKEIGGAAKFLIGDIFDNDYLRRLSRRYDVGLVFSNGVLEHFSDSNIIDAIKIQSSVAEYVVFSVPSDGLDKSQVRHGDERLLSRNKWRHLIKQSECRIIEEFKFGGYNKRSKKPRAIGFVVSVKS